MLKLFRFCAIAMAVAMFGSAVLLMTRAVVSGWVPIPTNSYYGYDLRGRGIDFETLALMIGCMIIATSGAKLYLVAANLKTNGPSETLWGWFVRGIHRFGDRWIASLPRSLMLAAFLLEIVAIAGGGFGLLVLLSETYRCTDQGWMAFVYISSPLVLILVDGAYFCELMSRRHDPWVYGEA